MSDSENKPSSDSETSQPERSTEWQRMRLWQIQPVRDVAFIAALVGLISLGSQLAVVTIPLLLGLGLAYLIEPLLNWLNKRWSWATRPRVLTAMVAVFLLSGALILLMTVPRLISQGNDLIKNRSVYADRIGTILERDWIPDGIRETLQPGLHWLSNSSDSDPGIIEKQANPVSNSLETDSTQVEQDSLTTDEDRIRAIVREEMKRLHLSAGSSELAQDGQANPPIGNRLQRVFIAVVSLFGGVVNGGMFLFLSLFFLFCFSLSYPKIIAGLWELVPDANKERFGYLVGRMDAAVSGFVRGRILICGTMALVYGVGWTIFGVPYALILALITGVLGLIPYAAVGTLPIACLLLVLDLQHGGESFWYHSSDGTIRYWAVIALPLIIFGIAQLLDDYVLTPIIQGKATNLDMVSVVVAVIAGGALAGLYGMLLAIPVAACLRILIVEVFVPYLRAWSKGERKDFLPLN